jgi:cytoskeletal protein CcmA (bactofilin family)
MKPGKDDAQSLSIIGAEETIQGDLLSGGGDLRIEGTVHGDIETEGQVYVAEGAEIKGTVRAPCIRIAGAVTGTLHADEELVLTDSSEVEATIYASQLEVEPGAKMKGTVQHTTDEPLSVLTPMPEGDQLPAFAAPPAASTIEASELPSPPEVSPS